MRICPECGYVDPPYWRHSKYSYWIDHTEYENFKMLHPKLCPLQPGGMIEDEHYVYRRMKKSDRVERKAIIDYEVYGWMEDMEKVDHDVHDFRKHWNRHPRLDKYFKSEDERKTE